MNVEALSTTKGVEFALKFINCHNTMMAIDESTTIKIQELNVLKTLQVKKLNTEELHWFSSY